ncbi:hypothetical protein G6F42_016303 [Rhizopus arrhizus]|nr:hypothetical protein G6F42_016303 [Rhizopus arrhizus]
MSNSAHSPDYLSTVPDAATSMVLGDFNYNFCRYRPPVPSIEPCIQSQWLFHSMMLHYYRRECTHGLCKDPMILTFRRNTTFSTIDYFFVNPQLIQFRTDQFVHFVYSEWTDHALLSLQLTFADDPNLGRVFGVPIQP